MLQQNERIPDYRMCTERVDFNFTAQLLMHNYLKRKIPLMQGKLSIMIPWKIFCATVHWCTLHCLDHLLLQTIVLSAYDDCCSPPLFLCPASLVWFVVEHTPALFQLVLNFPFVTSQSLPATNLSYESNPAISFTNTCIHVHMYARTHACNLFVHISSSLFYSLHVKFILCSILSYMPLYTHLLCISLNHLECFVSA